MTPQYLSVVQHPHTPQRRPARNPGSGALSGFLPGFFALALSLFGLAAVTPVGATEPYEAFFDQTLGHLQEELDTAKESGKQGVLLFFEMDECPFCSRMKQTVFSQPRVQEYFREHFLILPIDIEGDTELTDFQGESMLSKEFATQKFRVRATPVMVFFDLEGNPLYRHTGPTRDADEFMLLGEYVLGGHYKNTPFGTYRRQKHGS